MDNLGRILIVVGIGILLTGGVLLLLSRLPFLNSLGGLPGDIRIEGQNFTCIIPLASMLLVSVILTIILNVIIRLINR
jgi:hypothetical protein